MNSCRLWSVWPTEQDRLAPKKNMSVKAHFHTVLVKAPLHFLPLCIPSDTSEPSRVIWNWINRWLSMEGLHSRGSLLLSPSRNPLWLYSELCLLLLFRLRFLKRPQWPLGRRLHDMEGGAWRSRSFYLGERMGTSATPVWPVSPIKKNTGGVVWDGLVPAQGIGMLR